MPAFVAAGQHDADGALSRLRLTVVGSGAVGGRAVRELAGLQIAQVILVDPGRIKRESLLTHSVRPEHVGDYKVNVFGGMLRDLSPSTAVKAFAGPAEQLPLSAYLDTDVIVMATDNLAAEVEVGLSASRLGVPLVQASVHGATLVAQVRAWSNRSSASPCLLCGYGPAEWRMLDRDVRFSCGGDEGGAARKHVSAPPTMSVGFLCSMAADTALMVVLRHALGLGTSVWDQMTEYCGYTHRTVTTPLRRRPHCRGDHEQYVRCQSPVPLGRRTLRETAALAGYRAFETHAGVAFTVGNAEFVTHAECAEGHETEVLRFVQAGGPLGCCRICGAARHALMWDSYRAAGVEQLEPVAERPLHALGAPDPGWVLVNGPKGPVLVTGPRKEEA